MKQVKTKLLTALVMATLLPVGFLGYYFGVRAGYVADETKPWLTQPLQEASYIIGRYNTTHYYARNQTGYGTAGNEGYEMFGTNASQIINWVSGNLTSGGTFRTKGEGQTWTIDSTINISNSEITWISDWSLTLKAKNSLDDAVVKISGDRVQIIGLHVDGNKANQATGHGLWFLPSNDAKALNCYIHDVDHFGIWMQGYNNNEVTGGEIAGNLIVDCGWNGIQLGGWISGASVHDNKIDGFSDVGISCFGYNNAICDNIIVNGNLTEGSSDSQWGLGAENGSIAISPQSVGRYNIYANNYVENAEVGFGIMVACHDNKFEGNTLINMSVRWSHLEGYRNCFLDNDILDCNYSYVSGDNNIIAENRFYIETRDLDAYSGLISIFNADNTTIRGNDVWDNYGVTNGVGITVNGNNTIIDGNLVHGWTYGINIEDNSNSDNTEVINNNFWEISDTGLRIATADLNSTWVCNNDFMGCTTGISDSGTGTIIERNRDFITENSDSTATCYNATWIPHGLEGDPTSITLSLRGNTIYNATWILRVPTVLQSNSTHFQIEFTAWETVGWTQVALTVVEAQTVYWIVIYKP